jgi:aconitase B
MWYIIYGLTIVGIFPKEYDALDYLAECIGGNIRPNELTMPRAFAIQFIGKDQGGPVFNNMMDLLDTSELIADAKQAEAAWMADPTAF